MLPVVSTKRPELYWFRMARIGGLLGKSSTIWLRGMKSKRAGRAPRLHPQEKQRIIRDVLIARTARRAGALLVTNNLGDFEMIQRFCNVRVKSGADFFRS